MVIVNTTALSLIKNSFIYAFIRLLILLCIAISYFMRQDLVEGFVAFVVCSLLWKQNFVTVFNNIENVDAGEKRASHGSAIKTRFISSRLSFEPASTSVVFRGIPFWSNPRTRLFPSSIHDSNQNWSSKGFFCCLMNITSNRLAFLTCAMVLKPITSACC